MKQFLILVVSAKNNTAEFVITIIAMPLTPIVILACGYAVRKENKPYVT
jgi:ABC-type transport system involved in cytochrome bd biosynthesis fused ATPase/permease subunit